MLSRVAVFLLLSFSMCLYRDDLSTSPLCFYKQETLNTVAACICDTLFIPHRPLVIALVPFYSVNVLSSAQCFGKKGRL